MATREISQLSETAIEVFARRHEGRPRGVRVAFEPSLQQRELERGGDEPLLRSVVQIALDPPARVVGRLDDPRA